MPPCSDLSTSARRSSCRCGSNTQFLPPMDHLQRRAKALLHTQPHVQLSGWHELSCVHRLLPGTFPDNPQLRATPPRNECSTSAHFSLTNSTLPRQIRTRVNVLRCCTANSVTFSVWCVLSPSRGSCAISALHSALPLPCRRTRPMLALRTPEHSFTLQDVPVKLAKVVKCVHAPQRLGAVRRPQPRHCQCQVSRLTGERPCGPHAALPLALCVMFALSRLGM